MCGTCGRQLVGECTCGYAAEMRAEIANLVKMGLTRDQVLQYYIQKYGSQEPLAMPMDKGFNRLAWFLPYVLGATGLLVVGVRRHPLVPPPEAHRPHGCARPRCAVEGRRGQATGGAARR